MEHGGSPYRVLSGRCRPKCVCVAVVNTQVKYDLTKAFTGDDDKETIHCELDVIDSNIEWLSGQNSVDFLRFRLSF